MDNDTKLSKEQIENIKTELKNGSVDKNNITDFLKAYLDKDQNEKLKEVLADPQKIKNVLASPFAKSLMEKFRKEE